MGNPTSYLGRTLTWEGKQLKKLETTIGSAAIEFDFDYDENGLRTSKTLIYPALGASQTTSYYYNGSVLICMSRGNIVMRFSYDAGGNVAAVDYSTDNGSNFTTYYYLRNAQNDIVKIVDSTGSTVVEYTYDTWGKILSVSGSLATTLGQYQPFGYRGYVYDYEIGLYYLQSRYYDPTTCRFISADVLLSTGQGIIGHNSFAYCLNNPVNMADDSGTICRPPRTWNETWTDDEIAGGKRKPDKFYGVFLHSLTMSFIDDQNDSSIKNFKFGSKGTIGDNGCGLIALYNVRVASGYQKSFQSFYDEMTEKPCMCLWQGELGMNPVFLQKMLIRWFGLSNVHNRPMKFDYDAIVVLYVWSGNGTIGAHYFAAISLGNGEYKAYNDKDIVQGNLSVVLKSVPGTPIAIWGIDF